MKKLTITVSDDTYARLYQRVGRGRISRFLDELARSRLEETDLEVAYREMASDVTREAEAEEWTEALVGDVADAPR